jgi:hypothetical protein
MGWSKQVKTSHKGTRMIYKFYGLLILSSVITFSVISAGMIALGGTQPPHPALRGFIEGCEGVPQPCWYGIELGRTHIMSAVALMEQTNFELYRYSPEETYTYQIEMLSSSCETTISAHYQNETTILVRFENCTGLLLGDVVQLWGLPDKFAGGEHIEIGISPITLHFPFVDTFATLEANSVFVLDLFTSVEGLYLYYEPQQLNKGYRDWRGFLTQERYCQLDADYYWCD